MRGGITILFIAGVGIFVIAWVIYGKWREKKRRQELMIVADELGLEYIPQGNHPLLDLIGDFK